MFLFKNKCIYASFPLAELSNCLLIRIVRKVNIFPRSYGGIKRETGKFIVTRARKQLCGSRLSLLDGCARGSGSEGRGQGAKDGAGAQGRSALSVGRNSLGGDGDPPKEAPERGVE